MTAKKTTEKKKSSAAEKEQHDHALQTLQEKHNTLLRAYADQLNSQKRQEKEWHCVLDEIKKRYLSELVDVYELLQKAIQDNDPKPGLQLMLRNLEKFFTQEQLTVIDCTQKPFDPSHHHAVSTVPRDDCDENIIVEEVKKGYCVGEKLLRPSQVIVAKKKETNNKKEV